MDPAIFRVARYRFRATLGNRWASYLVIVVLVGLVGGLAMGSIAAARRTQSSFSTFLASTDPSDLTLTVYPTESVSFGAVGGYSETLTRSIERLPGVRRVESWVAPFGVPLSRGGRPELGSLSDLTIVGSVNGLSFNVDRAAPIQGTLPDPKNPREFVTTAAGAAIGHWHLGQDVPFGFYTVDQVTSPSFASGDLRPLVKVRAKLVGLVQFTSDVVQDETDRYPTFVLFTPALTKRLLSRPVTFTTYYGIQAVHGAHGVAGIERAFTKIIPTSIGYQVHVTQGVVDRTERAIKPLSIALAVFGVIAALATLAIGVQSVARQLKNGRGDLEVLRALGAGRATALADGLVGILGSILLAGLLAAAVAVTLSPIGPLGPVRPVYPERGFAFDWTVLGSGVGVIVFVLGGLASVIAYRSLPYRTGMATSAPPPRRKALANLAAEAGLPPAAVAGVRFATEPGRGPTAVPVRSALLGTALAVTVVATTLTFGSGLSTLVAHPALYGWNWSYALFSETGPDVPPQAMALLAHDPDVGAYSEGEAADPTIDGQSIPALFEAANAAVLPPIVSGHAPVNDHQIVLGGATMKLLGVHRGDTVSVSYGRPQSAPLYVSPKRLTVVGTATFPAFGFPSTEGDHTAMGTGALIPIGLIPASFQRALQSPDPTLDGPEFVFVRMRDTVDRAAAGADVARIVSAGDRAFARAPNGDGEGVTLLAASNLLPAEITNYQSIGVAPSLLAASLALGAVAALTLTLFASVRRRRRDLALLKTLGFTSRQISASVVVQATVVGLFGLVVGLPVGIALGRWLWTLFANQIYAVPAPTVPVWSLVLVGVTVMALVNIVALLPGRAAARTPTAMVLRTE